MSSPVDDDAIVQLVEQGDLSGAAALARTHGRHALATSLLERACDFGAAARAALDAGEVRAAARLAALADDPEVEGAVLAALGDRPADALAGAHAVDARRAPRLHARLLEIAGEYEAAGGVFESAGDALSAARCLRLAGQDAAAARVLEVALRIDRGDEPDEERLALAELYASHRKFDAAARLAQRVGPGPARERALVVLEAAYFALGLERPLAEVRTERRLRGAALARPADARGLAATDPSEHAGSAERLLGRYTILRTVAETPHARVLEARDCVDGERVALKMLGASLGARGRDAAARFLAEARALDKLRHPHIVPLRAAHESPPIIVLEWMAGGSLAQWLVREPRSPARCVAIARAVLEALSDAHRIGVVHRDVKPSNVLFDGAGTPRLADFGAAHLAGAHATMTAGAIGTLAYMAPEQRRGEPASPASDLHAVGTLLHEMLTGALPQPVMGPAPEQRADRRGFVARAHPDLDERHERVLEKLLAEDPRHRPATAVEAASLLAEVPWSTRVVAVTPAPVAVRGESPRSITGQARLLLDGRTPYPGGRAGRDTLLERDVVVVLASPAARARAAAWSACSSRVLATIFCVEPGGAALWCELPRGNPLGVTRLTPTERRSIEVALRELHERGSCHGSLDGDHLFRTEAGIALAFPAGEGRALGLAEELVELETISIN